MALVAALALPVFTFAAETAFAAVAMPQQFYGTVSFQNGAAPDGVKIDAKIDGAVVASGLTSNGKYGYNPNLFFVTDQSGLNNGKTIQFYASGIAASQTATFQNGAFTNLNLTVNGSVGSISKGENDVITDTQAIVKPSAPLVVTMGDSLSVTVTSASDATSTLADIHKLGDAFYSGAAAILSGNNVLNGYEIKISGSGLTINVVLHYSDSGIDENSIKPYRFDGSNWVAITPFTIDKTANTVSFNISSANTPYVIFGQKPAAPAPAPVVTGGGGGGGGGGLLIQPLGMLTTGKGGDTNNDGKVDLLDFNAVMVNWGKTGANLADLSGDGVVDILDFNLVMVNWSK